MKEKAKASYLKKGQDVVDMNYKAIDLGATAYKKVEVPADWANAVDEPEHKKLEGKPELVKMVKEILEPVGKMDGDSLPVSAFSDHVDGQFELGASAYEKRGVAVSVPTWDAAKCIQCNQCAYVCPHATIRPFALTAEEAKNAPEAAKIVDVKAGKGKGTYQFTMAISPLDCMGCGVCIGACPVNALSMVAQEGELEQQDVFDYCVAKVSEKKDMQDNTVKGSQFKQPMLEFSGSCAGCAETSYARLVTQLFGDHMYISNATGCSSIWGGPAATSPYCTNKEGHGPAWCNSLFEDNAEHGLGMFIGQDKIRQDLADETRQLIAVEWARPELKAAAQAWLDTMDDGSANAEPATRLCQGPGGEHLHRGGAGRRASVRRARRPAEGPGQAAVRLRRLHPGCRHPQQEGIPGQEVHVDLRRRRLGLRHRLRRPGSRHRQQEGREHLRVRHRGVLQHRRTGLQGLQHRPGGSVCRCR